MDFDALQQEVHQQIIQIKGGKAIADKIFKMFLKNGKEKWILVHTEIQDKDEEDFSKRMFRYFYRIYDRFNREIYAIALLTNTKKSRHPNHFIYSFYGTEVNYKYNTYDFHGKDIEKLKQSSNPFATAVIAGIYASNSKKTLTNVMLSRKIVISILERYDVADDHSIDHLNKLIYFVDNLLQLPAALKQKLREDLNPYLGKEVVSKMRAEKSNPPPTLAELIAESEHDGIEKGKKEVAIELIRDNFSDNQIKKLTKLSFEDIAILRKSLQN